MRIIAGEFRRRIIKSNPGNTTRPITDRAKESLFARMTPLLEGKHVADIFAGTGSLGLEALSRGATGATFFERDPSAVKLLKENIESLDLDDCTLVWPTDILRTSFKPKGVDGILPWGVTFFDPPYKMVETIRPGQPLFKSLLRLARSGSVEENGLLVFRRPSKVKFTMPDEWQLDEELDLVHGLPRSMRIEGYRLRLDTAGDNHDAEAEAAGESAESPETASDPEDN